MFTKLTTSVDSILASFHKHVQNLETLIEDRTAKIDNALIKEAEAIKERLAHSNEVEKAKNALAKIRAFIE